MARFHLKLFVAGRSPRSRLAIESLERIRHEHLGDDFEIDIIDIYEAPDLALAHRIVVTPMLVKDFPPLPYRICGSLGDTPRVLSWLGLT